MLSGDECDVAGRARPWEEIWQATERLVREGKVTYAGSSNFAGWDSATAQTTARSRQFLGLVSEQSLYNPANRAVGQEMIPAPPPSSPLQPAPSPSSIASARGLGQAPQSYAW